MDVKKIISSFLLVTFLSFNGLSALAETKPVGVQTAGISETAKIEHMPQQKNKYLNTVKFDGSKAVITQGNTLKIKFAQEFNSKTAKAGDKVIFILDEGLNTEEGTLLLPKDTQIIGTVLNVQDPMWWNKNAKVAMSIGEIKLPNGMHGKLNARIYSKDSTLRKTNWATFGKFAGWTVGLFGVGAGVGAGIGAAASAVGIGCFAIGMPVGAGLGLIIGGVTPGQHYKAKPGKPITIQLTQDLEISLDKI